MKVNRTDQGEPITETSWPKHKVNQVECRKRDLVVRITDWSDDKEEPAYDVELYINGVYDWNESQSFTRHALNGTHNWKKQQRMAAIQFAQLQIAKHLK